MARSVHQFCSEDGPMEDGGDGPCSVRCSLGVCQTGVGPNPGSGLDGTPGFRCEALVQCLFGIRPRHLARLHQGDRSSNSAVRESGRKGFQMNGEPWAEMKRR